MTYPSFYNQVESIVLYDPLSDFLGAFEKGIIEFNYVDLVKSAGHSCPTIAGAYLIVQTALKVLYPNAIPQRGNFKISFKGSFEDGVIGVMSAAFTQITGSAGSGGFKGIAGNYSRNNLLIYDAAIDGEFQFERRDTGEKANIIYQPIPPHSPQQSLMKKIQAGNATSEEKNLFKQIWQNRVAQILLEHSNDSDVIRII